MNASLLTHSRFKRRPLPARVGAFTLLEMLVVIAVIAVLTTILFPVLGSVRASAQSARCVSNLRQVGVAIQAYASDNKGTLPATGFFGISSYYNRDLRNFQNSLLNYLSLLPATTWSTSSPTDMSHSAIFDCPGYKGADGGKCYLLQQVVTSPNGTTMKPWGAVSMTGAITTKPLKTSTLPDGAWAIRDNDSTPTDMNHTGYQNTLYFDWHVGRVAVNN